MSRALLLCALAGAGLLGCPSSEPAPTLDAGPTDAGPKAASLDAGPAVAEQDAGPASDAAPSKGTQAGEVEVPLGFDPLVACGESPLDPAKIPPVPVRGIFARNQEDVPSLPFDLDKGGAYVELRDDRASLRMSSEPLRPCSPFRADGGVATGLRLAATFDGVSRKIYLFPEGSPAPTATQDPALPPGPSVAGGDAFKHWNFVYNTTDQGTPFTMNAFSTQDVGLVVFDELDEAQQKAVGRVLLCKDGGRKGWAAGNFEAPLCDKRSAPSGAPGQPALPTPEALLDAGQAPTDAGQAPSSAGQASPDAGQAP
jgi:hypothetical protein